LNHITHGTQSQSTQKAKTRLSGHRTTVAAGAQRRRLLSE